MKIGKTRKNLFIIILIFFLISLIYFLLTIKNNFRQFNPTFLMNFNNLYINHLKKISIKNSKNFENYKEKFSIKLNKDNTNNNTYNTYNNNNNNFNFNFNKILLPFTLDFIDNKENINSLRILNFNSLSDKNKIDINLNLIKNQNLNINILELLQNYFGIYELQKSNLNSSILISNKNESKSKE